MEQNKKMANPMIITVIYLILFGVIREAMLPMAELLRLLLGVAMLVVLGHNLILSRRNGTYFQDHKLSYLVSFAAVILCLLGTLKMDWAFWTGQLHG